MIARSSVSSAPHSSNYKIACACAFRGAAFTRPTIPLLNETKQIGSTSWLAFSIRTSVNAQKCLDYYEHIDLYLHGRHGCIESYQCAHCAADLWILLSIYTWLLSLCTRALAMMQQHCRTALIIGRMSVIISQRHHLYLSGQFHFVLLFVVCFFTSARLDTTKHCIVFRLTASCARLRSKSMPHTYAHRGCF